MVTGSRKITSLMSSVGGRSKLHRGAWPGTVRKSLTPVKWGKDCKREGESDCAHRHIRANNAPDCPSQSSKNKARKAWRRQNECLTLVLFYFSLVRSRWPQSRAMSLLTFSIPHFQKRSSVVLIRDEFIPAVSNS